ncbi:acyltransferase domain-containing protein [Streptomyces sp. NPDC057411]|uniref:acyltransferase domain-containing protein n=1 Tax=unclassified Streptomyces TaxID=2593676 RepID=UPI0036351864
MTVRASSPDPAPARLLTLSAPTVEALERATDELADRLDAAGEAGFARLPAVPAPRAEPGAVRRAVLADSAANAARWLRKRDVRRVFGGAGDGSSRVFLFSGVGDQYPGLGAGLYRCLPAFRDQLDRCFGLLADEHGLDLRPVLFPPPTAGDAGEAQAAGAAGAAAEDSADPFDRHTAPQEIHRTVVAQPLLFALQYSLARALTALGAPPAALAGYSVGEYTAACVAGVFPVEDALRLVTGRARLVDELPPGAMLAVAAGPEALDGPLAGLLPGPLSLAALNGPQQTVLSGPVEAVEEALGRLTGAGLPCQRLATAHAYHSAMTEPLTGPLEELLGTVPLARPAIPLLSNVTGTWLRDEEATSPAFWARQLSRTLRFSDELATVWRLPDPLLVELGPGQALTRLALGHPDRPANALASVVQTLPGRLERRPERELLLAAAGRLWAAGAAVDWSALTEEPPAGTEEPPVHPAAPSAPTEAPPVHPAQPSAPTEAPAASTAAPAARTEEHG